MDFTFAFLLFIFALMAFWQTSKRKLTLDRPLVMAILNVTPDSFSDGGKYAELNSAINQAEKYVAEGADIIDIGGESTRPGSTVVSQATELQRVLPVIEALSKRIDIPISIDTTKSLVARSAIDIGAEIINDISGLRFDRKIAKVAAETGCGLVLMHSRGSFETMHSQPPVADILTEVHDGLSKSINLALDAGVNETQIALDIGIGFGKTFEQNLELLANLDRIRNQFSRFPMVVGTSRKSFLGRILGGAAPDERLSGSLAGALIAAANGASVLRVHDVRETVEALRVMEAIRTRRVL